MQTIETKREALDGLCLQYHVGSLEVFGSAATGNLREDSDLDFLVEFLTVDSMSLADQYFGLLEALERLFDRKVDLLTRRMSNISRLVTFIGLAVSLGSIVMSATAK